MANKITVTVNKGAVKAQKAEKPEAAIPVGMDETNVVEQEAPAKVPEVLIQEAPKAPTAAVPPVKATVAPSGKDLVKIRIMRLQAAPEVGQFKFIREFKVAMVRPGQTYMVPRYVASHLKNNRVAVITV